MIRIIFKNLDESELAKDIVHERLQTTIDRFPDLENHRILVTLGMDNSPTQSGPDSFSVKLRIVGKKYNEIVLEKSALSLYTALADVVEHSLERLNRFGDRQRIKSRNRARQIKRHIQGEVQVEAKADST